jgi:homopolymeric O-antigen transport system ATP-binding protein
MRAILEVEDLSKQYRLGARQQSYATLRDSIAAAVRAPFRFFSRDNSRVERIWALRGISFDVQPGATIGIIGRNGAGKSTLLKVLSRITEPTSGRIRLYGRVGSLLEVGTGFHPELTGRENVFLNGAIIGMRREEINRKFDEIVAFSEIERFIDTPVKHYSSGMYTRLAFAVAAHLEPEILVIDEVLSVGDLAFQKKCFGKMSDVAGQGRTVLFVSHNMEAVRKICDQAILLDQGEIVSAGKTENVIGRYIEEEASGQSVYPVPPPSDEENPPGYAYKLRVEDGQGRPSSAIPVGSPWQIRVYFKINRRVEHFIIALGLWTSLNANLRASWSDPKTIEPGDYQAVFREETLLLATGRYPIGLGLSSFERSFHYVENVGSLGISDVADGIDLVRISGVGVVLNPMKIKLQMSE